MNLPRLANWDKTRQSLHQAAQVLAAFRKAGVEYDPKFYRHLSLQVTKDGLSTGETSFGEITLHFKAAFVVYQPPVRGETQGLIPLMDEKYSQATLSETLLRLIKRFNQSVAPDISSLNVTSPFEIDPQAGDEYAQVLNIMHQALHEVWSELPGEKLPPVLFPHGFDLSCLWFAGKADSEQDSHMNFGFSPRSPGLERPYFYSYAHPLPNGYFEVKLPARTRFHREGWSGTVLSYDDLIQESDPVGFIKDTMRQLYKSFAPLLK